MQAGYLIRSVDIEGTALHIDGDLNATVPIRVLGAPSSTKDLHFNSQKLSFTTDPVTGEWSSTLTYTAPQLNIPNLSTLDWKCLDDLPELQATYDDSAWTAADHSTTNNSITPLLTPTSLFGSDYGYNTGALIFRGHFTADGSETSLYLNTQGGWAFGSSVWIGDVYVGSWTGIDAEMANNSTYTLPNLVSGKKYILTVVVDNNGLDENWVVGPDLMKAPRGILNYELTGRNQSVITWKLTGNLGGEQYVDKVRILFVTRSFHSAVLTPHARFAALSTKVASTPSDKASHSPTPQTTNGPPAPPSKASPRRASLSTKLTSTSTSRTTTTSRSPSSSETRRSTALSPIIGPSCGLMGISLGSMPTILGHSRSILFPKVSFVMI